MANLFGTLTAIVMALSIWIGFKNQSEYENQIELRKTEEARKAGNDDDYNKTVGFLTAATEKKEGLITQNDSKTGELNALKKKVSKIEKDISEKTDLIASNKVQIERNDSILKELPNPEVLIPQISSTQKKIAELKADLKSDKAKFASLTQMEVDTAASIEHERGIVEHQSSGRSLPTLKTSIQAVYRNWGFVTLNGGNAQGVVPGSTLDVMRGGEVVAKLKVTAVEQNRAAADIITDAVPVAVSLRAGDRVVAEQSGNSDQ